MQKLRHRYDVLKIRMPVCPFVNSVSKRKDYKMKLGEYQTLQVVKNVDFGVYLAKDQEGEKVLLPKKLVPPGTEVGSCLNVFLYKDSKDRPIATTLEPKLTLGKVAALKVLSIGSIGAFLDWGLEKDLFLPFKEMTRELKPGDEILVRLYLDKSSRLCASMKELYHCLEQGSPYQKDDVVKGRIYEFSRDFGTFLAVDDRFSAMLPAHEDCTGKSIGDVIEVKVTKIKPDGKLDVTRREKSYIQMDADAKYIMQELKSHGGKLPYNDKTSAEIIKKEMKMSKNAFKRAIGRLYKQRQIEITIDGIQNVSHN